MYPDPIIFILIILFLIAMILYVFFFERYFVEIKEYDLGYKKQNGSKIKVLQISDLHLKSINYPLRRIAKDIITIQPNLILFTGDMFEKNRQMYLLDNFLDLIDNKIPKVAILGNWEIMGKADLKQLHQVYEKHNCRLIIDDSIQINLKGKTLSLTGVDDYLDGHPDIDKALRNYQKGDFHILLSHCPGYFDIIKQRKNQSIPIDLILSGHTHGGQVNFLGYAPYLPGACGKFIAGWYQEENYRLYVSKGIGTSIYPIRLGARAEITLFNIAV